jgi:hypothetical protein
LWKKGRGGFVDRAQIIVKLKRKDVCIPSPSLLSVSVHTLFLSFIVVKLPKRWWKKAPKSRGSLLRCTGEWWSYLAQVISAMDRGI